MEKLISVIVPIYHVEAYLHKSVDSILAQTYRNLEVILVDDGGTDGCPAICEEYAEKDVRVKVIHKKNGGLSDARNAGVAAATGAYIAFVDSDDFLMPDMYEKMIKRMETTGAGVVVCNYQCVKMDGIPIPERNQHMSVTDEVLDAKQAVAHLYGENYEYWVTAWSRLYRADVAKAVAFPKGKIHEDEYTAHMFYDKAGIIAGISEPLYQYVIREDSIMTRKYSVKNLAYVEALNNRIWYCMEHDMKEIGQGFLRWMCRYLMDVSKKLDRKDEDTAKGYREVQTLYKNTYRKIRKNYGMDVKNRILRILFLVKMGV